VQTDTKIKRCLLCQVRKKSAHDQQRRSFFADGKPKEKESFPESKASDQREVDKVGFFAAVKKTE